MPIPHTTSKRFKPIGTICLGPSSEPCPHDSLQLLRPTYSVITPEVDKTAKADATAQYLAKLSETMLKTIYNNRDFTDPLLKKHICPSLTSKHDVDAEFPSKSYEDLDDHMSEWRMTLKANPSFNVDILDTVAEVYESGRKAKTWSVKRVGGLKGGLCKDAVSVGKWERRGQLWVLVQVNMVRGVTVFE